MTERERLIDLLKNNYSCINEDCKKCGCGDKCFIYRAADYLLANGVIVLPVKVGEMVYSISRGQIIPIQIDTIQYTKRGIDIYGSNEKYFGYSAIHLDVNNQIGIQWCKTKEEAEKSLKERQTNENT